MAQDGVFVNEFKACVSRLVSMMGYSIESSAPTDDGFMFFTVKSDPLGDIKTLVYVFVSEKNVSQNKLRDVFNLAKDKNVSKVVLVSTSGFSDSALKFSEKHGMRVIDKAGLEDLMRKYSVPASKSDKIFEFAFDLGRTPPEAMEYFDRDRGRKFFGFGIEEKVVEFVGKYAPVGSFLITRVEEVKMGITKTSKTLSKSNIFYVNLSTNELYYISKGLGKPVKLESSNILNRLMFLPINTVKILADILKNGEMSVDELNEKYELFYEENRSDFVVLVEEGFIAPTLDKNGFMPSITMPTFDNSRYDLRKFMSIGKSISSNNEVDELRYDPKDVVKLLEILFAGKGEVREVIYLPYYTCRYVDDRGMSRHKILLASKYLV